MFDWVTLSSSVLAAISAGGWLTSKWMRKKDNETHLVELERARAEADALRQRTELDYTKEILEIYSAHIVQPLKDEINRTNKRLDYYEQAFSRARDCRANASCPVVSELQSATFNVD